MKYYHVYTKGLEKGIIFRNRDDYVAGMNLVAVSHFKTGVRILAFVLMSNHFHFVIYGRKSDVVRFINLYKTILSRYILHRYGESAFLNGVETSCDEIDLSDEGLKKVIAYVLDNPVKAGIGCLASNYEWGSGSCYFSGSVDKSLGIPLCKLSTRNSRKILHSGVLMPSMYRLNDKGYVAPSSYVDAGLVENIFGRAKSFEYFLATSASSRQSRKDVLMFSDAFVSAALDEILRTKYGAPIDQLDEGMLKSLLLDLRKHFNASAKQRSRVTGLSLKFVLSALD